MKTVLWFCDAHDVPDVDKSRFHLLGQLIADKRPDTIIQGGDFLSMESLSHWDKDKRQIIEGRRLAKDLQSAIESWKIVEGYVQKVAKYDRYVKRKFYHPDLVWFEGNHEDWLNQYVQRKPEWEGIIEVPNHLEINENLFASFDYVPWKEIRVIDGILYCHAPIGRTGPIYSKYITTKALIDMSNIPIVFGHTHRRQDDTIARYDDDGNLKTIRSVCGGCFFDEWPHYAEGNTNDYWQGCLLLHVYDHGKFDVEEWSLERLRKVYDTRQ